MAAARLGAGPHARPGHGLVREHLRGMAMQSMGDAAYQNLVRRAMQVAEEIMTVLEEHQPVLVGRAAKGYIDGGATLHIRVHTALSIGDLAAALVDAGYEEPSFETVNTRFGRLSRLRFEEEGCEAVVTRCPPQQAAVPERSLYRDERVESIDLRALRSRLSA
jgi:hypothetical protein